MEEPIDEIVGYLNSFASKQLETLRTKYPQQQALFKTGTVLGSTSVDFKLKAEAAHIFLKDCLEYCQQQFAETENLLRRAKQFRYLGQAVNLIGSLSVFATLAQSTGEKKWTYLAGVITLLGTLLTLYAQYLDAPLMDKGTTAGKRLQELNACEIEARILLPELESWIADDCKDKTQKSLISKANDLSRRIRTVRV